MGSTEANLKASVAGETHEYTDMYPGMAKTAREKVSTRSPIGSGPGEGRKSHAGRFQKALDTLDAKDAPVRGPTGAAHRAPAAGRPIFSDHMRHLGARTQRLSARRNLV